MQPEVKVLGIRHHGPGSARNVHKFIMDYDPDIVLIEGIAEANEVAAFIEDEKLVPPVAMLIYNKNKNTDAVYLPFAAFSPEWVAAKAAIDIKVPFQFIDLPLANYLSNQKLLDANDHSVQLFKDPFAVLSEIAGYDDVESWYDYMIESSSLPTVVFDTIMDLMVQIRKDAPITNMNLYREAYMRTCIKKYLDQGYQKIVVVCGAFHAPVLHLDAIQNNVKSDKKLLLDIKNKENTTATWIPWTNYRLSVSSGYKSGIISPAWFEFLYQNIDDAPLKWFAMAAEILRKENIPVPTSSVMDAIQLLENLKPLRDDIISLEDLKEVALCTFCNGNERLLELLVQKIVIGDKIGEVPIEVKSTPLHIDIELKIKEFRLKKYYLSTETTEKELDLRDAMHLEMHRFFTKLALLDIHWSTKIEITKKNTISNFKTYWSIAWTPESYLEIISASAFGNTIGEACKNKIEESLRNTELLPELVILLENILVAHLHLNTDDLIQKIINNTVKSEDVNLIGDVIAKIVNLYKYGGIYQLDTIVLKPIIDNITPLFLLRLHHSSVRIDAEAADLLMITIIKMHHAISIYNNTDFVQQWKETLYDLHLDNNVDPQINGLTTRILFDYEVLPMDMCTTKFEYIISSNEEIQYIIQWLSGFLYTSGQIIIHNEVLWNILNNWVANFDADTFRNTLPLMRKIFSKFTIKEKSNMLMLAQELKGEDIIPTKAIDLALSKKITSQMSWIFE
jgi:Family of unknown function (DUF5682)